MYLNHNDKFNLGVISPYFNARNRNKVYSLVHKAMWIYLLGDKVQIEYIQNMGSQLALFRSMLSKHF